jgi:hypothetical protein
MGYALGELYGAEIAKNVQNLIDYGYSLFSQEFLTVFPDETSRKFLYDHAVVPLAFILLDINWVDAWFYVP